jgi:Domain of unknown function (DUF4062)
MARIYISSTYSDLKDYRETVYRTLRQLRHDVIAMEDYVATDERPVEKCLKDVAGCDVYVGIFAFRYGFTPKDGNLQQLSITELEYHQAGDKGVARLIFLVKEGAAWPTTLVDAIVDPPAGERIAKLRSHLKESHVDSFFESAEELARQVSIAVQQQLQLRPLERVNIDWEEPRRRMVDHMRRFGGARSEPDALKRYFPLTLQGTTAPTTVAGPQFGSAELPRGGRSRFLSLQSVAHRRSRQRQNHTAAVRGATSGRAGGRRYRFDAPTPLSLFKSVRRGDRRYSDRDDGE